jgi:hypothetical protein
MDNESAERSWKSIYRAGAAGALLAVLAGIVEIAISFVPGSGQIGAGAVGVANWFTLFQQNWFIGMRNMGLINIFLTAFGILLAVALYGAHRKVDPAFATLATVLSFMGAGIFFATNRAFAMWALSNEYAVATTEAQKTVLLAAGQAMLAVGQSHTAGTFLAFCMSELASILIGVVMLRGKVFSRVTAWTGILGFAILLSYEIGSSFSPALYVVAMYFAIPGGLLSMAWYILTARRLLQL